MNSFVPYEWYQQLKMVAAAEIAAPATRREVTFSYASVDTVLEALHALNVASRAGVDDEGIHIIVVKLGRMAVRETLAGGDFYEVGVSIEPRGTYMQITPLIEGWSHWDTDRKGKPFNFNAVTAYDLVMAFKEALIYAGRELRPAAFWVGYKSLIEQRALIDFLDAFPSGFHPRYQRIMKTIIQGAMAEIAAANYKALTDGHERLKYEGDND